MCQGGDINFNFSTICVKKIDQPLITKNAKKLSNKEIQSPSAIEPARDDSVLLQFGGSREDIIKFQTKFDSLKKVSHILGFFQFSGFFGDDSAKNKKKLFFLFLFPSKRLFKM